MSIEKFIGKAIVTKTFEEFEYVWSFCEGHTLNLSNCWYENTRDINRVLCVRMWDFGELTFAHLDYYQDNDVPIVTFEEFKSVMNPAPKQELIKKLGDAFEAAHHLQLAVDKGLDETVANVNPKQALGLSSVPMNMLSPIACAYGSIGKLNGKLKYGQSNFLGTEVIMSIYVDAIRRHLDAIMVGEEYDPADGVPHFGAMLANIDIILCARAAGTLIDDRPLLKGYRDEMDKLKPIVNQLYELHKDKNPKHWYLDEEKNK